MIGLSFESAQPDIALSARTLAINIVSKGKEIILNRLDECLNKAFETLVLSSTLKIGDASLAQSNMF